MEQLLMKREKHVKIKASEEELDYESLTVTKLVLTE